jgi:hypothetical protein
VLGAIPGLGGSVTDWIVYGHAIQTEKNGQFGKGDVRGVIAVEASNNAREGGALVPTLFFGIPSSGSMAVFLGGMTLIGIEAGPQLVGERLDLTYAIIWSLAIANVIGTALCFVTSPMIAKLTTIRFGLIAPFMIIIVCFGAFNTNQSMGDLLLLLGVGVLGLFMRRFGWPRPPFVVGFVLAQPMETYLYQAVQFYGWGFLQRPGVLIIGALILLFVILGARQRKLAETEDETEKLGASATPQAVFALVPVAIFAMVLWDSSKHSFLGAVFPAMVGAAMLPLALFIAIRLVTEPKPSRLRHDGEQGGDSGQGGFWTYLLWFAGLIALSALVGFLVASIAFFIAFLRGPAKCSWATTLTLTAIANVGLVFVAHVLTLDFPSGVLQSLVELPWPLR